MIFLLVAVGTLGLGAGACVYAGLAGRDWRTKLAAAALPMTGMMFLLQCAGSILLIPQISWNDPRLARTVSLLYGYHLYYGREADGPIIGTLHNPLSQLIYLAIGWLDEPVMAILAGSCLSFLFVFAPLVWLHVSGKRLWPLYALLACGLVMQQNAGMRYSTFSIHTDAAALGFATLAAGIFHKLGDAKSRWANAGSALCAVLSVWCKQTMIMAPLALLAFVWLAYGARRALVYIASLAMAGMVVSAAMLAIFWPPQAMLFNTLTMAGGLPEKSDGNTSMLGWFEVIKADCPYATIPLLFLVLNLALACQGSWREVFARNRWLAFALIGLLMLPVSIVASRTMGGYTNHYSLFSYFLLVGATLGMCEAFDRDAISRAAKIFAVILIILNLDLTAFSTAASALARLDNSPSQIAYRYSQHHPGKAYFPWNPLAVLLSESKLYHFDYALFDREMRGLALSESQLKRNLPDAPQLIAIPPNDFLRSAAVIQMIKGKARVNEPGLDGWQVYRLR